MSNKGFMFKKKSKAETLGEEYKKAKEASDRINGEYQNKLKFKDIARANGVNLLIGEKVMSPEEALELSKWIQEMFKKG
jgi:hypothetical protein